MPSLTRLMGIGISALLAASCVAAGAQRGADPLSGERWAAFGYLSPGQQEPELIGVYSTQTQCRAAVDVWTSRQVVGSPVSGVCNPVDTN